MAKKLGRKPKESWPECKYSTCDKTTQGGAHGFCHSHYVQMHRGAIDKDGNQLRAPQRIRSYGEQARCSVTECLNRPKGRGLCSNHYQQWKQGVDLGVEVPDRGHPKTGEKYAKARCIVLECPARPVSRWMCSKHAQQRAAGIIDEGGNPLRELMGRGRTSIPGSIVNRHGYLLAHAPEGYTGKMVDGRVLEHRLVMEQALGRLLQPHEIVHHIDGNKQHNEFSNLEMRTRKTHPPAHEHTIESTREALEHLRHNDPAAYVELMKG